MTALRSVLMSGAARAAGLVPTALASLVLTRIVLTHYGIATYDDFALLVALIALLPFNDLGVGSAVTSAFAATPDGRDPGRGVLLTAARVLATSSAVLIGAAAIVTALGGWNSLLGGASTGGYVTGIAVVLYAASFLPGLGQSVLIGLDRSHVAVLVQGLTGPLTLVGVGVVIWLGVDGRWIVLAPAAAVLLMTLTLAAVASRNAEVQWLRILRDLGRRRRAPGSRIRSQSLPAFVIAITVPLALQTDRIVLSHVSTPAAVADYSVAVQVFAPVIAVLAAAATPLWPMWVRRRHGTDGGLTLLRVVAWFCAAAAVPCAVLIAFAGPIGHLVGGHAISLGLLLPVAATAAVLVQAAAFPISMAFRDPDGLRFNAWCAAVALPLNVLVSIVLSKTSGAAGPLLATAAVGSVVQVLPALYRARHTAPALPYSGRHRGDPVTGGNPVTVDLSI